MVWKIVQWVQAFFSKRQPVTTDIEEPETPLYGMRLTPQQAEKSHRTIDSVAIEQIITAFDQGQIDRDEARYTLVEMIWVHAPRMSELDLTRLRRFVDFHLDQIVSGQMTINQAVTPLHRAMFKAWRGADALRDFMAERK